MARSLYIAATEAESGKSAVALGLLDLMTRRAQRVAVFRPVVRSREHPDSTTELLLSRATVHLPFAESVGVTYDEVHADHDRAVGEIVRRYRAVAEHADVVLVVGTDFTDVGAPTELSFNALIAVNLGSPVLAVVNGRELTVDQVGYAVELTRSSLAAQHCEVVGLVVNRMAADRLDAARTALRGSQQVPVHVMPEEPLLTAPTMGELVEALHARLIFGDPELLAREALGVTIAAMTLPGVLDHLTEGAVVVTPGDRAEVLVGVLMAHRSDTLPSLTGIVLSGGIEPPPQIVRLIEGIGTRLPIVVSDFNTFVTAATITETRGALTAGADRKIETALALFEEHVDAQDMLDRVAVVRTSVVTPMMFEYELLDRARSQKRRIVLPEGTEERVLRAADSLLRRGVVDVVILGSEHDVRAKAAELGLDLSAADVVDPYEPTLRERLATEYARQRSHKGTTLETARDVVVDVSYCGTLMVALGLADGMVSGAAHTTAHTIRPSFEVIRTRPGVDTVSSVFFMCLSDRVLVYGDCAVVPDPTAAQLADIAISSAATARQFGIEPRVAMLSYSTGESGSGADVDKVREATRLVRERAPELAVEGPIQYDAAVDPSVAATKMPGSQVAGRATVLVFPDLNTGNNTYKAVQRSAGAVAIGPVLQGLRKPVNDLSRGALVQDIVNTVAITAIQAQSHAEEAPE